MKVFNVTKYKLSILKSDFSILAISSEEKDIIMSHNSDSILNLENLAIKSI